MNMDLHQIDNYKLISCHKEFNNSPILVYKNITKSIDFIIRKETEDFTEFDIYLYKYLINNNYKYDDMSLLSNICLKKIYRNFVIDNLV